MTPKIVTRLANIAAKLAGSDKYDPTIEPKTAFEYYLDKGVDKILAIKGVPAAEVSDKGKVLSVSDSGAPVWENRDSLIVTFSGTTDGDDATCDRTWEDIQTAISAGKTLALRYQRDEKVYIQLLYSTYPIFIQGSYTYVGSPENPTASDYLVIYCSLDRYNGVEIIITEF